MLPILKKSLTTVFLFAIPLSAIAIAVANKPVIAGCNPFGCSQSSAAECNPFGYPNPPIITPLPIDKLYRQPQSLGSFVAGFKMAVTKRINIK